MTYFISTLIQIITRAYSTSWSNPIEIANTSTPDLDERETFLQFMKTHALKAPTPAPPRWLSISSKSQSVVFSDKMLEQLQPSPSRSFFRRNTFTNFLT